MHPFEREHQIHQNGCSRLNESIDFIFVAFGSASMTQKSLRERFGRSSEVLLRSSSARFASQERFGCVLDSILGLSGLQNRCSRVSESIDFIKSAFPQSIFNLISKSPLKMPSKTPHNRSSHLQSASRELPDALRDAFWSSLGVS